MPFSESSKTRPLACPSDAASAATVPATLAAARLTSAHGPWSRVVEVPAPALPAPRPDWSAAAPVGWRRQNRRRPLYPAGQLSFHLPGPRPHYGFRRGLRLDPAAQRPSARFHPALGNCHRGRDNEQPARPDRPCHADRPWQHRPGNDRSWVTHAHPPTQLLGRTAYDSGCIAGIKYTSAKHPGGINLVVFPARIPGAAGSFLHVYDPHRNLDQRIGP